MTSDVSSIAMLVSFAMSPSAVKQSKFDPLSTIDTLSFLSLIGRWNKTLVSTDTVWISAALLSSATSTRTWRFPETTWVPVSDTSKSFRFCTFSSHCQSSQSGGMPNNFRERIELGWGKLCNAVGSEMVTVSRRGRELKASVNLPGNVDVRRGFWISTDLIYTCFIERQHIVRTDGEIHISLVKSTVCISLYLASSTCTLSKHVFIQGVE